MYTSGHHGPAQGAMLTHGNIAWNNVNFLHTTAFGSDEVALVVAPLFHIGGLNVTTLSVNAEGRRDLLHRTFDPGAVLEALSSTASRTCSVCRRSTCS